MKYVSPREYKELTGTTLNLVELRKQVDLGNIKGIKTETNHYFIEYEEIDSEYVENLKSEITKLKTIIANMIAIGNGANDETINRN